MYVITGMPATVENADGEHRVFIRFDDQPAAKWVSASRRTIVSSIRVSISVFCPSSDEISRALIDA